MVSLLSASQTEEMCIITDLILQVSMGAAQSCGHVRPSCLGLSLAGTHWSRCRALANVAQGRTQVPHSCRVHWTVLLLEFCELLFGPGCGGHLPWETLPEANFSRQHSPVITGTHKSLHGDEVVIHAGMPKK